MLRIRRWTRFDWLSSVGAALAKSHIAVTSALASVQSHVFWAVENLKITKAVIKCIAIDVVDMLMWTQQSSQVLFHEPAMIGHSPSFGWQIDTHVAIKYIYAAFPQRACLPSRRLASSRCQLIATTRAVRRCEWRLTRQPDERLPALMALALNGLRQLRTIAFPRTESPTSTLYPSVWNIERLAAVFTCTRGILTGHSGILSRFWGVMPRAVHSSAGASSCFNYTEDSLSRRV